MGLLSLVGLPRFDPPPALDEFKLMVEQDMGDKPNLRSMGEEPLEDPIDIANPLSSDLRDKGLITSKVSIFVKSFNQLSKNILISVLISDFEIPKFLRVCFASI